MRTRFSKGYRISNFITPTLISNGDLMILSTIDSDQAFALQIECISSNTEANKNQDSNSIKSYNDDNPEPFLHIQSAVLYTHGDGTRRIRVHNACLPIVNRLIDVFEGIDAECLSTFFLKSTIDKIFKTKKMSNSILQFSSMAKNMMSAALSAQQSLKKEVPENLIPLILYILGSLKNRVLCKDEIERKLDIDLSNYMRIKLQKLSTFDVQSFIYPRIYPLQSVLENPNIGVFNEDNSLCELPQVIQTKESFFAEDGLYLIDNGFILIIYITQKINPILLNSLFGVNELEKLNGPFLEDTIFCEPDEIKQKIMNIIDYIRRLIN